MIHPATELRPVAGGAGAAIGFGVHATAFIPAGTVTWVRDPLDQAVTPEHAKTLPPMLQASLRRYSYRDTRGNAVLCWDHARFNNHSCRPSCRTVGDFDIAVRDIPAGGELTIEYATINVFGELACSCGEPDCRRVIRSSDVQRLGDAWDAEIAAAARRCASVEQPLASLFGTGSVVARMVERTRAGRPAMLPRCRDLVLGDGGGIA